MSAYDHYALLGVARDATESSLKAAYYRQIRQHHPDMLMAALHDAEERGDAQAIHAAQQAVDAADNLTRQLNKAYDVLSDVDKRRAYDLTLPTPKIESPRNPNPEPIYHKSRGNIYTSTVRDNLVKDEKFGTNKKGTVQENGKRKRSSINKIQVFGYTLLYLIVLAPIILNGMTRDERSRTEGVEANPLHPANLQATADALRLQGISSYDINLTNEAIVTKQAATQFPYLPIIATADVLTWREKDYATAYELYTQSIALNSTIPKIFLSRARVGVAIGPQSSLEQAVMDFSTAIDLKISTDYAYSERANARYLLWQTTNDPTLPDLIRLDISAYQKKGGIVTEKMEIMLNFLP